jgi:predicted lipoprotein
MKANTIKNSILLILLFITGYNAVYFKKLNAITKEGVQNFDAKTYTAALWKNKMPAVIDAATEFDQLLLAIEKDPQLAFEKNTHALAIGNYRYAMVKMSGIVVAVHEDDFIIETFIGGNKKQLLVTTEFIYGSAVRDASGLIDIKDFTSASDLNAIAESFNETIKKTVIQPFKKRLSNGLKIQLVAAVELNKENMVLDQLVLLPVQINPIS